MIAKATGLDPRTKLILALMAAGAVALSPGLGSGCSLLAVAVVLMAVKGPFKRILRWLAMVLPMALFFGLVTGIGSGAEAGLLAGVKLMAITAVFAAFFAYTTADELGCALISWGLGFQAAFVFTAAMQFVPIIGRKARQVIDAQRCRGLPVEPGWRALRHWPALMVPLVLQCFQLAEEMAEAMAARGFGRPGRSFARRFSFNLRDWIAILLATAALAAFIQFSGTLR